jgi:hypothetical protein
VDFADDFNRNDFIFFLAGLTLGTGIDIIPPVVKEASFLLSKASRSTGGSIRASFGIFGRFS